MAFKKKQTHENRHTRTWPFRRHYTVQNENISDETERSMQHDSDVDITRSHSLRSIFATNSSKTIAISEENIPHGSITISINTG